MKTKARITKAVAYKITPVLLILISIIIILANLIPSIDTYDNYYPVIFGGFLGISSTLVALGMGISENNLDFATLKDLIKEAKKIKKILKEYENHQTLIDEKNIIESTTIVDKEEDVRDYNSMFLKEAYSIYDSLKEIPTEERAEILQELKALVDSYQEDANKYILKDDIASLDNVIAPRELYKSAIPKLYQLRYRINTISNKQKDIDDINKKFDELKEKLTSSETQALAR